MIKDRIFDVFMPLLPKNELSHWVGRMAYLPLPEFIGRATVAAFAKYYDINMEEAEYPLDHYRTIGELFIRKLKAGSRPIGEGVVHPADAFISEAGRIDNLTLIQAKGKTYSVEGLLCNPENVPGFEGGSFFTYYLCPTDYHRVHSPVDGEIIWSCSVPGEFWPVNPWSVRKIDQLFNVNERVIVLLQTPKGKVALVMVAATNVGNMKMTFDPSIDTQVRKRSRRIREWHYEPGIKIRRGDEVGVFNMGSTVVTLFEPSFQFQSQSQLNLQIQSPDVFCRRHVKMGQSLKA